MADIFSKNKRSDIMSKIRSSGTKPEAAAYLLFRAILGHRRRIDTINSDILGHPDLFIPSLSLVVFVDGCFYHGCPIHGHIPKTHKKYWAPKLERTAKRDRRYRAKLRKQGYAVWRLWEHDLKSSCREHLLRVLEKKLSKKIEDAKSKHPLMAYQADEGVPSEDIPLARAAEAPAGWDENAEGKP